MKYEYNKLRGRIIEKYGSQSKFAEVLGISENSLSKKMNSITQFSQSDVERWCELLDIPRNEIPIFFYPESWTE